MKLDQLLGISTESYNAEPELSLLDQLNQEIATESAADDAIFGAYEADALACLDVIENVSIAMAEKECANEGVDAVAMYNDFGLELSTEAAKDVLARKAYAAWAAIKALIKTLIGWFKKLLGFATNAKKVFKKLSEKAKTIKKEMRKVLPNLGKKEVEFEVRDYSEDTIGKLTTKGLDAVKVSVNEISDKATKGLDELVDLSSANTTFLDTEKDELKKSMETWKETLVEDKNAGLHSKISAGLDTYEKNKDQADIQASIDKGIKALEKLYKELDKKEDVDKTKNPNARSIADHQRILTSNITAMNINSTKLTHYTRSYVTIADYLFTDAKKLIAKAM